MRIITVHEPAHHLLKDFWLLAHVCFINRERMWAFPRRRIPEVCEYALF
jgi:hypothetical protein